MLWKEITSFYHFLYELVFSRRIFHNHRGLYRKSSASVQVWKMKIHTPKTTRLHQLFLKHGGNGERLNFFFFFLFFWGVKRSRLRLQAWKNGKDEIPERGVLGDEEPRRVCVCVLRREETHRLMWCDGFLLTVHIPFLDWLNRRVSVWIHLRFAWDVAGATDTHCCFFIYFFLF